MDKLKKYLKTGNFPVVHTRMKIDDIRFTKEQRKHLEPYFCTLCYRDILWNENFTFYIGDSEKVILPPDVLGLICIDCQKEIENYNLKKSEIKDLEIPK